MSLKMLSAFTLIRAHPLPNFGLRQVIGYKGARALAQRLTATPRPREDSNFLENGMLNVPENFIRFRSDKGPPTPEFWAESDRQVIGYKGTRALAQRLSATPRPREDSTFLENGMLNVSQNFISFHSDKGPPTPEFWAQSDRQVIGYMGARALA